MGYPSPGPIPPGPSWSEPGSSSPPRRSPGWPVPARLADTHPPAGPQSSVDQPAGTLSGPGDPKVTTTADVVRDRSPAHLPVRGTASSSSSYRAPVTPLSRGDRSRSHLLLSATSLPRRPFRACAAAAAPKCNGGAVTCEALLRRRVRSALASSLMPELPVLPWALFPFELFPTFDVPAGSHQLLHRSEGPPVSRQALRLSPKPVCLGICGAMPGSKSSRAHGPKPACRSIRRQISRK